MTAKAVSGKSKWCRRAANESMKVLSSQRWSCRKQMCFDIHQATYIIIWPIIPIDVCVYEIDHSAW